MTSSKVHPSDGARGKRRSASGFIASVAAGAALLLPGLALASPAFFSDVSYPVFDGRVRRGPIAMKGDDLFVENYDATERRSYVQEYKIVNDEWREWSKLWSVQAPVPGFDNEYGAGLAFDGATLLIGQPMHDGTSGRVGFYKWDGLNWAAQLIPADGDTSNTFPTGFGAVLAVDGAFSVSGVPDSAQYAADGGAVYVMHLVDSTWSVFGQDAGSSTEGARFGTSVAISGSAVAAGTKNNQVKVFEVLSTGFGRSQWLTLDASRQGWSEHVAIDGDTLVAGGQDGADVFVRQPGDSWTWNHTQRLVTGPTLNALGHQVAVSANLIVVTTPEGKSIVFERGSNGVFAEHSTLTTESVNSVVIPAVDHEKIVLSTSSPEFGTGGGARHYIRDYSTPECPLSLGGDKDLDGLCGFETFYLSTDGPTVLNGVQYGDEDIVKFEERTNEYSMYFDGSDVGLGAVGVDAFMLREDGSILMSFDGDITLPGAGSVKKQDVVRFVPTSLGDNTAGVFQPFFVGRDHGLTASNANITGVYEANDGRLFLNFGTYTTIGSKSIATEDIVQFDPQNNSFFTAFDGTDVGLGPYSLGAFSFEMDGSLLLSLTNYPTGTGLPGLTLGKKHDAFVFTPTTFPDSYGVNTSGRYRHYYVGADNGAPATMKIDGLFHDRMTQPEEIYQAEWAQLGGGTVVESINGGYNGAAYVNSSATGGSIEFGDVQAGYGGPRVLRFRSALGAPASRTGRLLVNGVAQAITFRSTGSFTQWTDTEVTVSLNPGLNAVRLESTGQDLANINQLAVFARYEAENATLAGGAVVESKNAGFVGTAYVNSPASGGSIEFVKVDGGFGGPHMLRIRYALDDDHARVGRLLINGAAQDIKFTPTGSWTTWTTVDVPIKAKFSTFNTIRFETTGGDLANIDLIEIH